MAVCWQNPLILAGQCISTGSALVCTSRDISRATERSTRGTVLHGASVCWVTFTFAVNSLGFQHVVSSEFHQCCMLRGFSIIQQATSQGSLHCFACANVGLTPLQDVLCISQVM